MESIAPEISAEGYFVKCILNASCAIFFPGTIQHRDVKREGISYEDDYAGNAMAATITRGRIDVRFHRGYSDAAVREIFRDLFGKPEMKWAAGFAVHYQGRAVLGG